jgi:hypothetical protein
VHPGNCRIRQIVNDSSTIPGNVNKFIFSDLHRKAFTVNNRWFQPADGVQELFSRIKKHVTFDNVFSIQKRRDETAD